MFSCKLSKGNVLMLSFNKIINQGLPDDDGKASKNKVEDCIATTAMIAYDSCFIGEQPIHHLITAIRLKFQSRKEAFLE